MREIFETLSDELRRCAAEGAEFAPVSDESLAILKRLAAELAPDDDAPQRKPRIARSRYMLNRPNCAAT